MSIERSSSSSTNTQQPASCFSCHAIGITSASALGVYMFFRAKKADSSTHRFTCALLGLDMSSRISTHSIDSINVTDDPQSVKRTLLRYILRTFYDIPKSLVVEYIYYHKCISLKDLAKCLYLNPKEIQSHIEQFKRHKYIQEERRSDDVYYTINMIRFVNVVGHRLMKMQSIIEDFERQQNCQPIVYKCHQCSKEYTVLEFGKSYAFSTGEDFICTCGHIVNESTSNKQIVDIRLFNEQMGPLFESYRKMVEILKSELSTTNNCESVVNINELNESLVTIIIESQETEKKSAPKSSSLPEWLTRSTIVNEHNDEFDSTN